MTVIDLNEYKPHLSGQMKCIICGHKWVGVCPVDPDGSVPCVECPECGLRQGFYFYPILPGVNEKIYKCNCGGEIFTLTEYGPRCIRCGILHEELKIIDGCDE